MHNHPDMCDNLYVTKFASDVVPIAATHASTLFKALLMLHLFSDTSLYSYKVHSYIKFNQLL